MSTRKQGKNNKSNSTMENNRPATDYPTREELVSQLAQLRSSLDGAYETLDSIAPSTDPDVTHKVADMVDIINGLHECEFELMDLLSKEGHVISPTPSRGADNPLEKSDEKCDGVVGVGLGDNESRSRTGSQEDLSVYGAYAVSSSRSHRNTNELPKADKTERLEAMASPRQQMAPQDKVDYIRRLEEIQKVNEKLVDRCRKLGLVLSHGLVLDKNISKMREVKDIAATKEQAQRKILELKALMQQVTDDKLGADISLAKIENDESYGRAFRYESRLTSGGASSISPEDHHIHGPVEDDNMIKKPRGLLGVVDSNSSGPDYAHYVRGPRQPFVRDHGERESAFVPIHNVAHLDPTRDKNKCSSNVDNNHADLNNEIKAPRATGGGASLLRRVIDGGNQYAGGVTQLDAQRHGRSSSARASLVPPPSVACNTLPNNLFRSNFSKSPPSMQSSSGMGSMNSRSVASLDNCRNEMPYIAMPRVASRNHEPDDNLGPRGFSERTNLSSNNLNKSYRQPTRSSSFYSELDFRNQEVFPNVGWDDDGLHTHTSPIRSRSPPEFRRRILSTIESQQITDELNRVLRCRNSDDSLPQPNWWSSASELGQADRHSYIPEHQSYVQRGKSLLNERTTAECYTQIMQLHLVVQEITQQLRNLTVTVAANKTATRDAMLQHRFDLHNVTRCIRDVSDMISDSMKRMEAQVSSQTRLIMEIETRMRRLEENQRAGSQKYESTRDREWQMPGRPDFMVSQDLSFQYSRDSSARERERDRDRDRETRENGSSGSMLNNQIPPGTRANNYWDNFRSYSRQNMLSKSNANVPQHFSHEASPSASESVRYTSSDALNNSQPATGTSDSSSEARRNGSGKNLWATSGFYENMSSKKRNKDQKSQSSTSIPPYGKTSGNVSTNSTAEQLRSTRDSHPEPDDTNTTPINRPGIYSRISPPQLSPYRRERDPDSVPYSRLSDFDLSWPSTSLENTRKKYESDKTLLQSVEIPPPSDAQLQSLSQRGDRDSRSRLQDSGSPNSSSHLTDSKVDREKHLHKYERSTGSRLDETRVSNHETLDNSQNADVDWVANTLDAVNTNSNSTVDYTRSPLHSPIPRPVLENNENPVAVADHSQSQSESNEVRGGRSSPPTGVSMNIRCDDNVMNENSGENNVPDRNGSSRSNENTSKANV